MIDEYAREPYHSLAFSYTILSTMKRFFEIVPALTEWSALILLGLLSWQVPGAVAIFIVLYDLHWVVRIVYLFFHLRFSFFRMRKNLRVDWQQRLHQSGLPWKNIFHLVVFPIYHEPFEVVRASIESICASQYPKEKIWIVLGVEERGGEADRDVARRAQALFEHQCAGILITTHPAGLPGEIPGKGSNETWATREAVSHLVDVAGVPHANVLVSVLDSDTRVEQGYFGILTYAFLTAEHPQRSSYQPIPLFVNNIHNVPIVARLTAVGSTFWQMMQQSRREQLATFSSHAIPLKPLIEMGYWHTDIVSEDSRIFFQGLIHFDGDWRTVPLHYPVYMDAVGGPNTRIALKNLYLQQRRWAWGAENIPYVWDAFRHNKKISLRKKFLWSFILWEGMFSWATSSFIIFLFGWLPNFLGGFDFRMSLLSFNMTKLTGILINISTFGIVTSAFFNLFLMPRDPKTHPVVHYGIAILQWFLSPITIIIFGGIPALDAHTRLLLGGRYRLGFWKTPKGNEAPKEVS